MYPALLKSDNFQVAAAVFWQVDVILFFFTRLLRDHSHTDH